MDSFYVGFGKNSPEDPPATQGCFLKSAGPCLLFDLRPFSCTETHEEKCGANHSPRSAQKADWPDPDGGGKFGAKIPFDRPIFPVFSFLPRDTGGPMHAENGLQICSMGRVVLEPFSEVEAQVEVLFRISARFLPFGLQFLT